MGPRLRASAFALAVTVVSISAVYALVWGVAWTTGDRSYVSFGVASEGEFQRYPGVLLGGPPPVLPPESPTALAMLLGVVLLILVGAVCARRLLVPFRAAPSSEA